MNSEEPAFKIKTGNLPVLQLHLLSDDVSEISAQLEQRLKQTPDFFASTPIVLELSAIAGADMPDFIALLTFMRARSMCPAGVAGGSAEQRAAAASAGLGLFPEVVVRNRPEPVVREVKQEELFTPVESKPEPTPIPVPVFKPTMIIDKPVRTGQRIYAEGASLIVLAIVNAGAELIADGDIHVYAPMRGKLIAGARGNESARIFVHAMEAELLSIAGCFKVFEEGMPENVRSKPAQVYLDGTRLVIEPLNY